MSFRCDDFLSRVKVLAQLPSTGGKLTDAEILDLALFEAFDEAVPLLRDSRENHDVKRSETTIVNGTARYRIPARTLASQIRSIHYVENSGLSTELEVHLDEVPLEDAWEKPSSYYGKYLYHFEGDEVVLVPSPTETVGVLRFRYYLRPSKLVLASACALASNVSATVVTTAAAGVPATIVANSTPCDFVEGTPQADVLGLDKTPTATTGTTITFAAGTIPAEFAIGDYVALAGETPMVPLPDAVQGVLAYATVAAVFGALGDFEAQAAARATLDVKRQSVLALLRPRNTGATKKAINTASPLRSRRRSMWGR